MPNYGDAKYWDKRYKEETRETFDWLRSYEQVQLQLKRLVDKDAKILNVGCGNAKMSEDMYEDGYENIWNIDISPVVIEKMTMKNQEKYPKMRYETMDCRSLYYDTDKFDLVIDKCTLDAIMCSEDATVNVAKMLKEIQRVLRVGGYYWCISYSSQEHRLPHLKRQFLAFDIEVVKMERNNPKDMEHFSFICKKKEHANKISEKHFERIKQKLILDEEREKILNKTEKSEVESKEFKIPSLSSDEEDEKEAEEIERLREELEEEDKFWFQSIDVTTMKSNQITKYLKDVDDIIQRLDQDDVEETQESYVNNASAQQLSAQDKSQPQISKNSSQNKEVKTQASIN